jgi:hypothetical protein
MTAWTSDELQRIGGSTEVKVSSDRVDGTARPFVTIWIVEVGGDLYVRSAYGTDNPWYRRAKASGAGRIRAGRFERKVTFVDAVNEANAAIDAAYHAKYDRYGPRIVGTVVGEQAAAGTLRLLPRD